MLTRTEDKPADSKAAEVAAIAAGVFAALGSTSSGANHGAAGGSSLAADKAGSNWKSASRRDALH